DVEAVDDGALPPQVAGVGDTHAHTLPRVVGRHNRRGMPCTRAGCVPRTPADGCRHADGAATSSGHGPVRALRLSSSAVAAGVLPGRALALGALPRVLR